jgi:peptidyl-tRNA hydrolase, PTH1 family
VPRFGRGRGDADRPQRRGTPADVLVIGLGNPGAEYERSRHNVGAEVVELLAGRHHGALKRGKERALVTEVGIDGKRVALAIPLTYVNLSGEAATKLVRRYGIAVPSQLVIVQDELDLPPAVVRVKAGGGLAGHNGLRSLTQHLKTQDYLRVRIGVGKPPSKERGAEHVLRRIPRREREALDVAVEVAADAVERIVTEGVEAAMREFNRDMPR